MESTPKELPANLAQAQVPVAGDQPARQASRHSWFRVVRETFLVVLITAAMILILLEVGLRLFAPQFQVPVSLSLFNTDTATRVRNRPGASVVHQTPEFSVTYNINQQGLREPTDTGAVPPGEVRLLNVGDSFTFGWGVQYDQAFPHLLDGSKDPSGHTIQSLNAGVPTYGPDDEVAWLHKFGWNLQPNILLVAFYAGNDVEDVMRHLDRYPVQSPEDQAVKDAVKVAEQATRAERDRPDSWLLNNSHAYVFLNRFFAGLFATSKGQQPGMFDTAYNYLNPQPPELATGWQRTIDRLNELLWKSQQHDVKMVVVVIPAVEQVDNSYWQDAQRPYGLTDAQMEKDLPQRKLAEWSAAGGAQVIDLLPGFRAAKGQKLYYHADPHWTTAGHALAANLIKQGMEKLGLLSP